MPNAIESHPANTQHDARPVLERLRHFGGARAAFLLDPNGEVACTAAPTEDASDLRVIAGGPMCFVRMLLRARGHLTSDRIRLTSGHDRVAAHAVPGRGVLVVVSDHQTDAVMLEAAIVGAINALERADIRRSSA